MTDSNPWIFFVSNGTKLVLVEKLDRLARDLMVQETIIGDLRKNGFDLISVMEPDLLQDDPSRKLMRQIFGNRRVREDHDRAQAPRRTGPGTRQAGALRRPEAVRVLRG